ncbi:MAG: NAD(P)-dependent oxidoreductase [Dehalococcoidia bacterium]
MFTGDDGDATPRHPPGRGRMTRVGFVGLGNQGAPIAQRIIDEGHPTTLFARRPATLDPFRDSPAAIADSLRDLGARSEVAFVCVVDDAQVEEVMAGDNLLAGMAAGSVAVILSTVDPETCRRMAKLAAERGVAVVDAPVSGGGAVAAQGALTVMVGGEPDAYQRCLPVLEAFGGNIQYLGGVGAGAAGKLINNFLFAGNLVLADQALKLGTKAGIEREQLASFLATGSGRSFALGAVESILGRDGPGRHAVQLLRKDVGLARRMAARLQLPLEELTWLLRRLEE